jgi:hypothetical protein
MMITKQAVLLSALVVALGACSSSKGDEENQAADRPNGTTAEVTPSREAIKSAEGRVYNVERVSSIKPENLPMNSDFKMADKNLAEYAQTLCMLDVGSKGTPVDRCDVYAQSEKDGTLIGYLAVVQDKPGARLESALQLNEKKVGSGSTGCGISGDLYTSDATRVADASKDFESQIAYSAWEKEPGNWLVAPAGPNDQVDDDPNSQIGVWYVKRSGDKLHVNQERWNYCYGPKSDVYVDDVFYRVVTLTRA